MDQQAKQLSFAQIYINKTKMFKCEILLKE